MDLDRETGELLLDITWLDETLVEPRFILGDKEAWVVSEREFRPLSYRMPIHCDLFIMVSASSNVSKFLHF